MAKAAGQTVDMMKAFIFEDAKEKAAEIEHKAASQAEVGRAEEVKREKARLEAGHKTAMVQVDTDARVARAKQKKQLDDQVLQKRVDALGGIREGAADQLRQFVSGPGYAVLIQQLTVQAAFVLEGDAVVRCRAQDKGLIDLPGAASTAEKLLRESGRQKKISLDWDPVDLSGQAAEQAVGGVFLSLVGDKKITCDNTLSTRLNTCLEEFAPVLRQKLFAQSNVQEA